MEPLPLVCIQIMTTEKILFSNHEQIQLSCRNHLEFVQHYISTKSIFMSEIIVINLIFSNGSAKSTVLLIFIFISKAASSKFHITE